MAGMLSRPGRPYTQAACRAHDRPLDPHSARSGRCQRPPSPRDQIWRPHLRPARPTPSGSRTPGMPPR